MQRIKEKSFPDLFLVLIVIGLVLMGISFVLSSSYLIADKLTGDRFYFFKQHLFSLSLGLIALICGYVIPVEKMLTIYKAGVFISILILILVFIPGLGRKVSGASRWLQLGFFRFQPSEVIKILLLFYLAVVLTYKAQSIDNFFKATLPPILIVILMVVLIALEPDISTSILVLSTAFIIFFLAGTPVHHLVLVGVLSTPFFIFLLETRKYLFERIGSVYNPLADPYGKGYHLIQSFLSFQNGRFFGVGPGSSQHYLKRLPEAHTDFIFAVIAEELGILGSMGLLVLFTIFCYKGFSIAAKQQDRRLYLLASGITVLITMEALMHFFVTLGLLPTTGLPLPFISFGRTAMVSNLFLTGILFKLSMDTRSYHSAPVHFRIPGFKGHRV